MDKLVTTPHDFIWRVKNPENYWADSVKEVKYIVYINGKELGGFLGVNRSFDDDYYYVNYCVNYEFNSRHVYKDDEMVLVLIK